MMIMFRMNKGCIAKCVEILDIVPLKYKQTWVKFMRSALRWLSLLRAVRENIEYKPILGGHQHLRKGCCYCKDNRGWCPLYLLLSSEQKKDLLQKASLLLCLKVVTQNVWEKLSKVTKPGFIVWTKNKKYNENNERVQIACTCRRGTVRHIIFAQFFFVRDRIVQPEHNSVTGKFYK